MTAPSRLTSLSELCVYGFIRKYCTKSDMPNGLISLCLSAYLSLFDAWDAETSSNHFDIDSNTKVLQRKQDGHSGWINAFGSFIIKKGDIHAWKIKSITDIVSNRCYTTAIIFGIIDTQNMQKCIHQNKTDNRHFCEFGGYGYYSRDGDQFHPKKNKIRCAYGTQWKVTDEVISMTLDLRDAANHTLSFKLNGKEQGVAARDMDLNKEYCMAMAMIKPEQIQLQDDII